MSKFASIVLCVVALGLTKVNSLSDAEKTAFQNALAPIADKCSKEVGVSDGDIKAAIKAGSVDAVNPCFLACVFKDAGVMDGAGNFDLAKTTSRIPEFVSDAGEKSKVEEAGKQCASVNDKAVGDGAAGCERAVLLLNCIFEQKIDIPL